MAHFRCPACSADLSDDKPISACPQCGKPVRPPAPISHLGGKLQVIGILIIASAIIAILFGGWWAPALLFPGVVLFILGKFW